MKKGYILKKEFFLNDPVIVGLNLINKILSIKINNKEEFFKIVETESYSNIEKASHTFGNKITKRNKSMFLPGGHIYVYQIYGMYFCLNVVVGQENVGQGVLIRGLEPLNSSFQFKTDGPGKICKALKINKEFDGQKINEKDSLIKIFSTEKNPINDFEIKLKRRDYHLVQNNDQIIVKCKRINIDSAGKDKNLLWRFYNLESKFVSKKLKI